MNTASTGVLIVGAGPAGLTLAIDLTRRGVPCMLVEQSPRLFPGSRGKGLQPRTLEVLDDLGVVDAVHRHGGLYPRMAAWVDGKKVKEWEMMERRAPTPHTPYPNGWMLPQWRTQQILHDRLRELGGEVVFERRLSALSQDEGGVTAELATSAGEPLRVRADYVVGADGGRSAVRHLLGISMTGDTVDPHPMLVADVRVSGLDRDNWHVWQSAEGEGAVMLCPLAGTEQFQLIVRYEAAGATPDTSAPGVRAAVASRTHLLAEQVTEVAWASEFRPKAALADRFQSERIFLIGDAAHIHSPAGGQGLNTSIQDAYNLGWKVGQVLLHGAPRALLDTYEAERRPVAAEMLGISTALHKSDIQGGSVMGRGDGGPRRGERTQQLGIGYRESALSIELRPPSLRGALLAGDRAPDARGVTPDGHDIRLFDAFRGPHFTQMVIGAHDAGRSDRVEGSRVRRLAIDGPEVRAGYGEGAFLVRPDGYVAIAAEDERQTAPHMAMFFGAA